MKRILLACLILIESSLIYLFYTIVKYEAHTTEAKRLLVLSVISLTITLFFFLKKRHKKTPATKRYSPEKNITNLDRDKKKKISFLETEFSYVLSDFFQGNRTAFNNQDRDIVQEYLCLKLDENTVGVVKNMHTIYFETKHGIILLELMENHLDTLFDEQTHYQLVSNGMTVSSLQDVIHGFQIDK